MKKVIQKIKFIDKKIIVILLIIIILIADHEYEEKKKRYLEESYKVALKANSLRQKYWGIEYYFEFVWFYSERNKAQHQKLDLNSLEFQEYLQSQYAMFRLEKSKTFKKVSEICYKILKYQINKEVSFLERLADHAAMAIIKTLNNNIVSFNKMDALKTNLEYQEKYGVSLIVPMNIFPILLDSQIIKIDNNMYSYSNSGTFLEGFDAYDCKKKR